MSVDKAKLLELNNLVSVHFRRKHKIVLNPAVSKPKSIPPTPAKKDAHFKSSIF